MNLLMDHSSILRMAWSWPCPCAHVLRNKPISVLREFNRKSSSLPSCHIPESKRRYVPSSGTYPQGFRVSGSHVGVKPSNTSSPDLAIILSDRPCSAAAVFTTNRIRAAPVVVSKQVLDKTRGEAVRAIVVNAGCANAVTGQKGLADAHAMTATVNRHIHDARSDINSLVMSTGVIGQRLPIAKILEGIPRGINQANDVHDSWLETARAICTTDTFPKLLSISYNLPSNPGVSYSLAGMTKGAGMIHPNMATLLGIMCTDAPISAPLLQNILPAVMQDSFNAISVDGDTSTNDTVAILANGAAGGSPIVDEKQNEDIEAFTEILKDFAQKLSHLVVRDGEGATKFIHIKVINSPDAGDARKIASSIARSPLVKTAIYGRDANWGRILCALGYTANLKNENTIAPERISVSFVPSDGSPPLMLLAKGDPQTVDEARALEILGPEDLQIEVDLGGGQSGTGQHQGHYWTCDLSHEYVTINGEYRT